jgi:hypothetical protein
MVVHRVGDALDLGVVEHSGKLGMCVWWARHSGIDPVSVRNGRMYSGYFRLFPVSDDAEYAREIRDLSNAVADREMQGRAAAREAAVRILAELADDGVTDAAVLDAERAAVFLDGLPEHHPLREQACDLRTALAELASPEGIGAAGVSALRLVGDVDDVDDDEGDP